MARAARRSRSHAHSSTAIAQRDARESRDGPMDDVYASLEACVKQLRVEDGGGGGWRRFGAPDGLLRVNKLGRRSQAARGATAPEPPGRGSVLLVDPAVLRLAEEYNADDDGQDRHHDRVPEAVVDVARLGHHRRGE